MDEVRKWFRAISHSVRGIRNGCILLVGLGILLSFLLHTLLPSPGSGGDVIQNLYRMHVRMLWERERDAFGPQTPSLPSTGTPGVPAGADPWSLILRGLESQSPGDDAIRGLRFAFGLGMLYTHEIDAALRWMREENERYPHPLVRRVVLRTALAHDRDVLLRTLMSRPDYAREAEGAIGVHIGVARNDWSMIFRHFWKAEYGNLQMDALLLSLIAGAVWAAMIAGLYPGPFRPLYLFGVPAALALGWISTWPTLWSGMWMDNRWGLGEGRDFITALAYYLVSVGLREEFCKLLLFAPFLAWTVRRGRDTEALILGAMVGLGFAIEENVGYVEGGMGGVMVSRFVSANILHFTLTGAAALALVRLVRSPAKWLGDSLGVFGAAIGLHALYNTLLSQPVPVLGDMSYFSGTALAGCVFLFFREASSLCPSRPRVLSQTALFCWGFCLILNLEMVRAAMMLPWRDAIHLTGQAALAGVFSGYIFLHQVREPLGE